MSKFFQKGAQESSSEDDSSDNDNQNDANKDQAQNKAGGKGKANFRGDSETSEEEERVVVSKAQKMTEALDDAFETMVKHTYNNDFNALNDDFDTIKMEIEKCIAAKVFATDRLSTLPTFVLKHLMIYEDCVLEVTNEQRKKMNKNV